jgi:hypothetical protein
MIDMVVIPIITITEASSPQLSFLKRMGSARIQPSGAHVFLSLRIMSLRHFASDIKWVGLISSVERSPLCPSRLHPTASVRQ